MFLNVPAPCRYISYDVTLSLLSIKPGPQLPLAHAENNIFLSFSWKIYFLDHAEVNIFLDLSCFIASKSIIFHSVVPVLFY